MMIPFSQRLHTLLEERQPPLSQARLAKKSGLDRSLISRLISGDRSPTIEALQCMAPIFQMDLAELVRGTDAEPRLTEANQLVRREDFDSAIRQLVAYEGQIREQDTILRTMRESLLKEKDRREHAEQEASIAHLLRERAERDLSEARANSRGQEQELRRYREGLSKAVADLRLIEQRFRELNEELASTRNSSRITTILAGVAAITGVATLTHFLGGDETDSEPSAKHEKKTTQNRRSR